MVRVEWPGFRGPDRDGVVRGVRIDTDWSASPPVEAVAPADRPGLVVVRGRTATCVYTQEQRGDEEIVAAIASTPASRCGGTRSRSGSGNRTAAPARAGRRRLHNGRVYTLGATGILNALDAGDRRRRLVAQRRGRHRQRRSRCGASPARRWSSTTWWSSPPPAGWPPTTLATGKPRWSARMAAAATARRTWRRSTASRRSCS